MRFVKQYRKRMVMAMPDVSYLDDRPVGSNERSKAQAWCRGVGFEYCFRVECEFRMYSPSASIRIPDETELLRVTRFLKAP